MHEYAKANKQSLKELLAFFNGNKNQMARTLKVSRNAVSTWFTNGRIGKIGAMLVDAHKRVPFTKEQLRVDVKDWDGYKKPTRRSGY